VQDYAEKGVVDRYSTVVMDEAQFPEFIHEEIDSGARRPDHLRQSLLRYFGDHFLRLVLLAIASEQQQSAGQPLFAGVKELIDQSRALSKEDHLTNNAHDPEVSSTAQLQYPCRSKLSEEQSY
jgi:hypothetical protein